MKVRLIGNLTIPLFGILLLAMSTLFAPAAHATEYPLTVTAGGSFAKSAVLPDEPATGQLSASATGAPQAAQVPNAGYGFSWIVVQKLFRASANDEWANTTRGSISIQPNPPGDEQQMSPISATFHEPGQYQIKLKAAATWWYGTGEDRGSGESQPPYVTLEIHVGGTLTVAADHDHLEADGLQKATISVHIDDADGNPLPNLAVSLTTNAGVLANGAMITDANGNGVVDANGNGTLEANEPHQTTLTAPNAGAMATVSAQAQTLVGEKSVLFHKVLLTDFSQPKLLRYNPDSNDTALSNPPITFTIGDVPQVAQNFTVTYSIHTLSSHDVIATKTEILAPGTYTRSWSDFFYPSGTSDALQNGRAADPGEGIYPFQVEATVAQVKPQAVADITDKNCAHGDWKSSKTLTIEWTSADIHYDDTQDKTVVSYAFKVTNSAREDAPPINTNLIVYDPDMQPGQPIPVTLHPVLDSHHIFYATASFPIGSSLKAGDYHFVVEARQSDVAEEGKDRGKFAIERNASANIPTFAAFGGPSPAATIGGVRYGQTLDFGPIAQTAADGTVTMGYRDVWGTTTRHWWMQNYTGIHRTGFSDVTDVVAKNTGVAVTSLSVAQIQQQTIQYHAVWILAAHGGAGNTMALWNPATGIPNNRADYGPDEESWSYLTSSAAALNTLPQGNTKISLDSLPSTLSRGGIRGNGVTPWGPALSPLHYARLVCFLGCDTAPNLPQSAVNRGALSSIGFIHGVDANQLNIFTRRFFERLIAGDNVQDAARRAERGTVGENNCDARRQPNSAYPTLMPPAWGDNLGPEQR